MFDISATALYSKSDLERLLEPLGLSVDAFLDRLRPRKTFKSVYFGRDLLYALENADPLKETPTRPANRSRARVETLKPSRNVQSHHEAEAAELLKEFA